MAGQQVLALITLLTDGGGSPVYPDQGLPPGQGGVPTHPIYHPPGIWGPTDPRPTHPIAPGGPPLGMWGPTDPRPSHPIAPGGQPPLGIWGPTDPRPSHPIAPGGPYPDQGLPGQPPLGMWGPGDPRPTHPIFIPPSPGSPPGTPAHPIYLPPYIDGGPIIPPPEAGGDGPHPEHPIALPPTGPHGQPIEWHTVWTQSTGWIVVGLPQGPVPTPAKT